MIYSYPFEFTDNRCLLPVTYISQKKCSQFSCMPFFFFSSFSIRDIFVELWLPVFPLSQVLRRPCLGSLVHQRTAVAKVQRFHWAKGAQSRHPNTRGRERMKAAWGTQMYQARPHKDLKLEARGATWPQRCHNRHQKNHRRRGRRLRSWSSTVVVSPWQEINFP